MTPATGILFRADRWSDCLLWLFTEADGRDVLDERRRFDKDDNVILDGPTVVSSAVPTSVGAPRTEKLEPVEPKVRTLSPHKVFLAAFRSLASPAPRTDDDWQKRRNAAKRTRQARRGKR